MREIKQRFSRAIDLSKTSNVAIVLLAEIILGVALTLFALAIFLKLGEDVVNKEVISFDASITQFVYTFRNPLLNTIMIIISFFGGEIFLGSGIIATILFLLKKQKKDALIFSFTLFSGIGLNLLLKDMFQRPRPQLMPLVHEASYSFPSGHAMNSVMFYVCLSFFVFRKIKNAKLRNILTITAGGLIFLIGISRIYLGAHYPSDVIAGYMAGLCWFVVVLLFEKTLNIYRLSKKS
jgi:membrane-associated phospholipid phosphatase